MTKGEYSLAMYAAKQLLHETEQRLMKEYAEANNNLSIGDFFTDRIGTIKIEKISLYAEREYPSVVYYGTAYTKKKQPYKSGEKRSAFQINEVKS